MFFSFKIVIICTQPTAHQEHLHTPYHILFSSFFLILCVYRSFGFFLLFLISFSFFCPDGVCMCSACIHIRMHALIQAHHRHNAHACCTIHIRWYYFQTNPQYHRHRWRSCINNSSSSKTVWRCNPQYMCVVHSQSYGVLQSLNS